MRGYVLALLSVLLGACASTSQISADYSGSDRGAVAVGIGAPPGYHYTSYSLKFRNVGAGGAASAPVGSLVYRIRSFPTGDTPDYQSDSEAGVVATATLPPGKYELFNFALFFTNGVFSETFSSPTLFSIPFEVRPGETAYLGNYFALPRYGARRLDVSQRAGALFAVESRKEIDVSIGNRKSLGGLATKSEDFTPNVVLLAKPFFITKEQRARILKQDAEDQ